MMQRKKYIDGFPEYGEGTLYLCCDYCRNEIDTKVHAPYHISMPEGWKIKDRKSQSQEGTNQREGTNIFCPKCG